MRCSIALSLGLVLLAGCKSASKEAGTSADLASSDIQSGNSVTTAQLKEHEDKIEKMLPQMRYEFQIAKSQSDWAIGVSAGNECAKLGLKDVETQKYYAKRLGFKVCEASTVLKAESGSCAVSCTQPIVEAEGVRFLTFVKGVDYTEDMYDGYPGCRWVMDRFMSKKIDGFTLTRLTTGFVSDPFVGQRGSTVTHRGCRFAVSLHQ